MNEEEKQEILKQQIKELEDNIEFTREGIEKAKNRKKDADKDIKRAEQDIETSLMIIKQLKK